MKPFANTGSVIICPLQVTNPLATTVPNINLSSLSIEAVREIQFFQSQQRVKPMPFLGIPSLPRRMHRNPCSAMNRYAMSTTNNRRLIRSGFWMRAHSMSNPRRLKSENIASTVESLLELKKRSGIGSGRSGDIPRVLFSNRPPASKVKRPTSFASDVDLLEISPLSRLKLKISQFQPAAIGTYPGVAFESKSEVPLRLL